MSNVFERLESEVRSYSRAFPAVFHRAEGSRVWSRDGASYLDFFSGAGAASYGHNHPAIVEPVLEYLRERGIVAALDMFTVARQGFLEAFERVALRGRHRYRVQFAGPGGASAVDAALKLARKVTGRSAVVSCMGAFHGNSLGGLSVTGDQHFRPERTGWLSDVAFVPYGDARDSELSLMLLDRILTDPHGGVGPVAAVIMERVQAEGGVNVAHTGWLREVARMCQAAGALLIVDDIQVGCYRTGPFFSFEDDGVEPDIILLSKAIGGMGAPLSLLLMQPELDRWAPGEHTATFRGDQLAFVAGTAALDLAASLDLPAEVRRKGTALERLLVSEILPLADGIAIRGLGLIWGVDFSGAAKTLDASVISRRCFERGLLVERVGRGGTVLKLLPPLTVSDAHLEEGLSILACAVRGAAA